LEKFMTSDNYICRLFECHANIGLNKIFSVYDNCQLSSRREKGC